MAESCGMVSLDRRVAAWRRRAGVVVVAVLSGIGLGAAESDLRLVDAVREGDTQAVAALLAEGARVDAATADGSTALHWAVYADGAGSVRRLLDAGAGVDAANDHGVTPLALACGNGSAPLVTALLDAGADPNATIWSGETALMTCARTGSAGAVNALLAAGADPGRAEPEEHQTALMWAVSERHPAAARALIRFGADVAARTKRGFTPLLFAAREGAYESALAILAAGADPDQAAEDATTPLVAATVRGHAALAVRLLEAGADPNAAGSGYTALHWAAGSWETELTGPVGIAASRDEEWGAAAGVPGGSLGLVRTLLAYGARVDARVETAPPRFGFGGRRDATGATPFFLAAREADVDLMRLLIDHGADPYAPNATNMTPLMAAAGVGRRLAETRVTASRALSATRFVWDLGGSDVNAATDAGDTALHGAAGTGARDLVEFLVERGAVVGAANKRGRTPLMAAAGTAAEDLLRELAAR